MFECSRVIPLALLLWLTSMGTVSCPLVAEVDGSLEDAASQAAAESTTTIRVFAEGLRSEEGQVRVSLFAAPDGFPDHGEKCLQWGFARLLGEQAYMVFRPVQAGRYAVAVFHDEDGNGKMRKDWIGRPQEGWGVSRDAEGHFGPPSFEDAAFAAMGDTMTIHLQMRY